MAAWPASAYTPTPAPPLPICRDGSYVPPPMPTPISTPMLLTPTTEVTPTPTPRVVSIVLIGGNDSFEANDSQQLTAMAANSNGSSADFNFSVAWGSSDNTVAIVNPSDLVPGVGTGTAQMTATLDGVTGTFGITATPAAPLTPAPTPTPTIGVATVPWSIIGGIIVGELALGLLYFLLMRSRTRRGIPKNARFLIIRLLTGSKEEEGKEVFYVLSRGHVLRVTPRQDNMALNNS